MKLENVETGLMKYIQEEIAGKAPTHIKFLIYTGTFLGTSKMQTIFDTLKENIIVKSLGVIDEDDDIDLENLYCAAKKAMEKVGTVEYMGIRFNCTDVDSLYNYIKRA
jgi:hypothetical protein